MNYYTLINSVLDYIDVNISKTLTVNDLSSRFSISTFHCVRIFKMMVGATPNLYMVSRKLQKAAEFLEKTDMKVIEIAYEVGYEYPEVFSKAFKKMYGISPRAYRKSGTKRKLSSKSIAVKSDIIDCKGSFILSPTYQELDNMILYGMNLRLAGNHRESENELLEFSNQLMIQVNNYDLMENNNIYSVVSCEAENDAEEYDVFCGIMNEAAAQKNWISKEIKANLYAKLSFKGNAFDVTDYVVNHFYKWVIAKEIQLSEDAIGMLMVCSLSSPDEIDVFIPIDAK